MGMISNRLLVWSPFRMALAASLIQDGLSNNTSRRWCLLNGTRCPTFQKFHYRSLTKKRILPNKTDIDT